MEGLRRLLGMEYDSLADRRAALVAMARTLRPGGTLILTSRNWERELAAGTRLEVADRLTERNGRRALTCRAWTRADPLRLEVAVSLLHDDGRVQTVSEALTLFPFTYDELRADLAAAGLEPKASTYDDQAERYLVAARRRVPLSSKR